MTKQSLVELQARRARAKAETVLTADSDKVTANIDHVIGPVAPPSDGLDVTSLLRALMVRPGKRTVIVVEDK